MEAQKPLSKLANLTGDRSAEDGIRTHAERMFNGLSRAGVINWNAIKSDFAIYLEAKRYNKGYQSCLLRYLNKYFTSISSPTDIMRCFAKIEKGQRHLWLGFRTVFNFLEATGYNIETLSIYRKALPTFQCGIDLNVPEEASIIQSSRKLRSAKPEYQALYNLLIDSGLRLIKAAKAIGELGKAEQINGYYRIALGEFRGSKQAYFAYLTEPTYNQIMTLNCQPLNPLHATDYYRRIIRVISPKYLRKFAFDKMVELAVLESIADFIEGRVPKRIDAKHYMVLRRQADKFYGKYVEYLKQLRAKVN
jgi:intergrase/recombinase